MNWRQAVLSLIATPEVLFLLLLGAIAGIGAEFSHPGAVFPGVAGTLCLVLFLFAAQILPINWAGVLLILLGIAFFVAEVKVTSYGLLTVGGLVALTLGAMMLIDAPAPEMRLPLRTLIPAVVVVAAGTIALVRLVVQAQRRRAVTGAEGMLGQHAVVVTDLNPSGWVAVQGERWRAVADADLPQGTQVIVTGIEGLTLRVQKG
jgi:membrane-bound serine protease (ClpP class)